MTAEISEPSSPRVALLRSGSPVPGGFVLPDRKGSNVVPDCETTAETGVGNRECVITTAAPTVSESPVHPNGVSSEIFCEHNILNSENEQVLAPHPFLAADTSGSPCASSTAADCFPPPINKESLIARSPYPIHSSYVIKEKVGQGTWGSVHVATERISGLERAVKKVPKCFMSEVVVFRQEVTFLKLMDHPNIVRLYETYEDYANVYMVMEYCRGGELFDRITEAKYFSESLAARLMRQILSALAYVHRKHITHRDLKPENFLFVSKDDNSPVKLIDFGLAKRFNSRRKLNSRVGTLYYLSPQVIQGSYDEKCDIWSAGVILYLLLAGTPPFNGPTDAEIIKQISEGEVHFAEATWRKLSPMARQLVQRLLCKNVEQRPSAAEALQDPWFSMFSFQHLSMPRAMSVPVNLAACMCRSQSPSLCGGDSTTITSTTYLPDVLKGQGGVGQDYRDVHSCSHGTKCYCAIDSGVSQNTGKNELPLAMCFPAAAEESFSTWGNQWRRYQTDVAAHANRQHQQTSAYEEAPKRCCRLSVFGVHSPLCQRDIAPFTLTSSNRQAVLSHQETSNQASKEVVKNACWNCSVMSHKEHQSPLNDNQNKVKVVGSTSCPALWGLAAQSKVAEHLGYEFCVWTNLAAQLVPRWKRFARRTQLERAALRVIAQQLGDGEAFQPLRSFFTAFDVNNDGALTEDELVSGMEVLHSVSKSFVTQARKCGLDVSANSESNIRDSDHGKEDSIPESDMAGLPDSVSETVVSACEALPVERKNDRMMGDQKKLSCHESCESKSDSDTAPLSGVSSRLNQSDMSISKADGIIASGVCSQKIPGLPMSAEKAAPCCSAAAGWENDDPSEASDLPLPWDEGTRKEMVTLVNRVSLDGSNMLEYSDFLAAMMDKNHYVSEAVLKAAFRVFDRDGDGRINPAELRATFGWSDPYAIPVSLTALNCAQDRSMGGSVVESESTCFKQATVGESRRRSLVHRLQTSKPRGARPCVGINVCCGVHLR